MPRLHAAILCLPCFLAACLSDGRPLSELREAQWTRLCAQTFEESAPRLYQCDGMTTGVEVPAFTPAMCEAAYILDYPPDCGATVEDWRSCQDALDAQDPCAPPEAPVSSCEVLRSCLAAP